MRQSREASIRRRRKAAPIGGGSRKPKRRNAKKTPQRATPPEGREPPATPADARVNGAAIIPYLANANYLSVLFSIFAPPCFLLRRFAAGTGGFLRLGAPRCGSRARPNALRRRVRLAVYCASVIPAVSGRLWPMGAERRRRQATNGSDYRSSARQREMPVRQGPRTGSRAVAGVMRKQFFTFSDQTKAESLLFDVFLLQ